MKSTAARKFAAEAHVDQQYGNKPYTYHLDQVADLLSPYGETAKTIGYLHDVVEDTEVTAEKVAEHFGALVANCVKILSDQPGENRAERKQKTYAKMKEVRGELELALTVKAADRLANIQACVADGKTELLAVYRAEQPQFYQAAYRAGQCDALWSAIEEALSNAAA